MLFFFFESLAIIGSLSLQAFFMNIHHSTFLKYILKKDFIFLTSKTYICSCSSKGTRLWLIGRSFVRSFCITHYFHFKLVFSSRSDSTFDI
jgi:hypothetical protein